MQRVLAVNAPRRSSHVVAIALMLVGLAVVLLAIFADTVGYGTGEGFGYYQMIVLIGGIIVALVGVAMLVHGRMNRQPTNEFEPEP
jgi:peptidoglycan/LPS O-acetylase OafA/YrhL